MIDRAIADIGKVIGPRGGGVHGSGLTIGCQIVWSIPRNVTGLLVLLSILIATIVLTGIASFFFQTLLAWFDAIANRTKKRALPLPAGFVGSAGDRRAFIDAAPFEKNLRNIVNPSDNVSYLAMSQSVLIAWNSQAMSYGTKKVYPLCSIFLSQIISWWASCTRQVQNIDTNVDAEVMVDRIDYNPIDKKFMSDRYDTIIDTITEIPSVD